MTPRAMTVMQKAWVGGKATYGSIFTVCIFASLP